MSQNESSINQICAGNQEQFSKPNLDELDQKTFEKSLGDSSQFQKEEVKSFESKQPLTNILVNGQMRQIDSSIELKDHVAFWVLQGELCPQSRYQITWNESLNCHSLEKVNQKKAIQRSNSVQNNIAQHFQRKELDETQQKNNDDCSINSSELSYDDEILAYDESNSDEDFVRQNARFDNATLGKKRKKTKGTNYQSKRFKRNHDQTEMDSRFTSSKSEFNQSSKQAQKVRSDIPKAQQARPDHKCSKEAIERSRDCKMIFNEDLHEKYPKNPDYFFSPLANDLIRIRNMEGLVFANIEQVREKVLKKLDELFGANVHVLAWKDGDKYVKIVCKNQGCVYQHWFQYQVERQNNNGDESADEEQEVQCHQLKDLWLFRNINSNHNLSCHCDAIERTQNII